MIGPREILALVGYCMMVAGLAIWSIAAALVAGGCVLLCLAAWPYITSRRDS